MEGSRRQHWPSAVGQAAIFAQGASPLERREDFAALGRYFVPCEAAWFLALLLRHLSPESHPRALAVKTAS